MLDNFLVASELAFAGGGAHLVLDHDHQLERRDLDQQIDILSLAVDHGVIQVSDRQLERSHRPVRRRHLFKHARGVRSSTSDPSP